MCLCYHGTFLKGVDLFFPMVYNITWWKIKGCGIEIWEHGGQIILCKPNWHGLAHIHI